MILLIIKQKIKTKPSVQPQKEDSHRNQNPPFGRTLAPTDGLGIAFSLLPGTSDDQHSDPPLSINIDPHLLSLSFGRLV